MKNAIMLYKHPGPHEIHGGHFDYIIVDADEEGAIDQALADGWHLTTDDAKGVAKEVDPETTRAFPDSDVDFRTIADVDREIKTANTGSDNQPPTREELEIKAKELGITVQANMKDATIAKKIEEALATKGA